MNKKTMEQKITYLKHEIQAVNTRIDRLDDKDDEDKGFEVKVGDLSCESIPIKMKRVNFSDKDKQKLQEIGERVSNLKVMDEHGSYHTISSDDFNWLIHNSFYLYDRVRELTDGINYNNEKYCDTESENLRLKYKISKLQEINNHYRAAFEWS